MRESVGVVGEAIRTNLADAWWQARSNVAWKLGRETEDDRESDGGKRGISWRDERQ